MKIAIDKMLVNRAPITRNFGIAGCPILQMYTHNPFLTDCIHSDNKSLASRFGKLPYNLIMDTSTQGGGHQKFEFINNLVESIGEFGVKEPLDG